MKQIGNDEMHGAEYHVRTNPQWIYVRIYILVLNVS